MCCIDSTLNVNPCLHVRNFFIVVQVDGLNSLHSVKSTPNRFAKTSQGRSWNTGNGSPDAICFMMDKPGVVLVGFCVYGGGGIHEYELEVLADDVSLVLYSSPDVTWKLDFWLIKEMFVQNRGWLLIFLKSTFMWWKSSRSRLVADDVINEQISLEMWQTPCAQLWNMTQRCPYDYCIYNSLFWSVL